MSSLSLSLFSFLSFSFSLPTYSPFSVTFYRPGQLPVSAFFFPSLQPQISLSLSLSLSYSPFNVFHSPSTDSIFISLSTLNQALFSYLFETLKLPAFSLPTSHQTAPDHTIEHFFTPMFDTMNSSYIKMVAWKYPPKKKKKKSRRIVSCNSRVFLSTYF